MLIFIIISIFYTMSIKISYFWIIRINIIVGIESPPLEGVTQEFYCTVLNKFVFAVFVTHDILLYLTINAKSFQKKSQYAILKSQYIILNLFQNLFQLLHSLVLEEVYRGRIEEAGFDFVKILSYQNKERLVLKNFRVKILVE